jgi:uncharacterized repeat protein (TIGR03803 family)
MLHREHSLFRCGCFAAVFLGVVLTALQPANAQSLVTIYFFRNQRDGSQPVAGVIRDSAGLLYGTTVQGGQSGACGVGGCGEVFRVNPATGLKTLLHTFMSSDGARPSSILLRDPSGNLYGTTYNGGTSGLGVIFKLDPSGAYTVLHNFDGVDGGGPTGGLVHDAVGNLYGTSPGGGANGKGVIYRVTPSGNYKILHSFADIPDGSFASAPLLRDSQGNLYGVAASGGVSFYGTLFMLAPSGQLTVLHNFTGGSDGANPNSGLVRDPAGNIYGVTPTGGDLTCSAPSGCGVIFKLDSLGNFTVLHTFTGNFLDGRLPIGRLARDAAGNLFGTTNRGGVEDSGTIFEVDTTGAYRILHNFQVSLGEGYDPTGAVLDNAENLYGTTTGGPCCGTVFEFVP